MYLPRNCQLWSSITRSRKDGSVILLQYLALRRLRVAKVHHLIEQFIDDDKVIADTLLLQYFEVFREYLHDLVQEKEDLGGIGVLLSQGKNVKVAVTDVEVLGKAEFSAIDLHDSGFLSGYARRADVGDGRHSGLRGTAGGGAGAPPQPRVGDTNTYVNSFVGKARSHGGALFFGVTE